MSMMALSSLMAYGMDQALHDETKSSVASRSIPTGRVQERTGKPKKRQLSDDVIYAKQLFNNIVYYTQGAGQRRNPGLPPEILLVNSNEYMV